MIRSNEEIELFIAQFNSGSEQYCEQKEDGLRELVESMHDDIVRLVDQYK